MNDWRNIALVFVFGAACAGGGFFAGTRGAEADCCECESHAEAVKTRHMLTHLHSDIEAIMRKWDIRTGGNIGEFPGSDE